MTTGPQRVGAPSPHNTAQGNVANPVQPTADDDDDEFDAHDEPAPVRQAVKENLDALLYGEVQSRPDEIYLVPRRPGVSCVYTLDGLTFDRVKAWRKQNAERRVRGEDTEYRELRLMATICASQSKEIRINGRVMEDDDGTPLTLRTKSWREKAQVYTSADWAVYFVGDPEVMHHGASLLDAAGFGDATAQVDPTSSVR
jgi:hypothetical protein